MAVGSFNRGKTCVRQYSTSAGRTQSERRVGFMTRRCRSSSVPIPQASMNVGRPSATGAKPSHFPPSKTTRCMKGRLYRPAQRPGQNNAAGLTEELVCALLCVNLANLQRVSAKPPAGRACDAEDIVHTLLIPAFQMGRARPSLAEGNADAAYLPGTSAPAIPNHAEFAWQA